MAAARDLFVWLLGGLGLLVALFTGLVLSSDGDGRAWLTAATPLSAAIAALLALDLLWALLRYRRWGALLMRLALLLLNGIFFVVELLALIAAQRAR